MHRLLVAFVVVLGFGAPALAQRAAREPAGYRSAVQAGMRSAVQQDYSAALSSFRQASGLHPESPEPHFFVGEVLRMQDNLEDALGEFQTAARLGQAMGREGDAFQARALFAIAATTQQLGRYDEARTAWVAYNTFADSHPSVSFSSSGRAHLQALDRRTEVANAAEPVRQRIEERQREAAEAPRRR